MTEQVVGADYSEREPVFWKVFAGVALGLVLLLALIGTYAWNANQDANRRHEERQACLERTNGRGLGGFGCPRSK